MATVFPFKRETKAKNGLEKSETNTHMKQDRQCMYKRNIGARSSTTVTVENQYVLPILSVCL
jgi:hypothetical protein